MNNKDVWDREYRDKKLMTGNKPQSSLLKFFKWVKKEYRKNGNEFNFSNLKILDLGSGNGKNSIFLAKKGVEIYGLEFSKNAIILAEKLKRISEDEIKLAGGKLTFFEKSIGDKFNFKDNFFDIIIDVTSSNSLNERERKTFLEESRRVLKLDGYFFSRGLLKDGDKNANFLLKNFPAKEKGTYVIPDFNLRERVFDSVELRQVYEKYFKIENFFKESHYTTYGDRKYKRNFWLLYLKK